ncbi:MAG: cell division protein ZapA [Bdellovibrionales bacterium]|nr:cell division protein ZapA [Bdellovibrionales bacterium]
MNEIKKQPVKSEQLEHREQKVASSQLIETEIAGLKLSLRSTHDKQTIDQLSAIVNGKLKEITDAHSEISFQNALILGALNLAEDYLMLRKQAYQDISNIEEKAKALFEVHPGNSKSHISV